MEIYQNAEKIAAFSPAGPLTKAWDVFPGPRHRCELRLTPHLWGISDKKMVAGSDEFSCGLRKSPLFDALSVKNCFRAQY